MLKPSILAFALLAIASLRAEAKVYLSLTNQTYETPFLSVPTAHKLNDAGATSATFTLPSPTRVAITFSAECRVAQSIAFAFIRIVIDGSAIPPTNTAVPPMTTDTIFCKQVNYSMHSITVTKALAAGSHRIRVMGVAPMIDWGYLRNSSLVVFD